MKTISSTSYAVMLPNVEAVCALVRLPLSSRYELDDTVLRAPPYAADIGEMANPLWDQINAIDAAAEAARLADEEAARNAPPLPYRVTKDAIMSRIAERGDSYVVALDDIILAQPRAQQILWRDYAWFMSNNANVRALIAAIQLDPEEILAHEGP